MKVILDTETTGTGSTDEVIELAIIDTDTAETLFHGRFRPTVRIDPGAQRVHGIGIDDLIDAPTWPDHHDSIVSILTAAERVLIYNADFDVRMINQTGWAFDLTMPAYVAVDLMVPYAEIMQVEYNNYYDSWKWQKLSAACAQQSIDLSDLSMHGALADCRATQRLYLGMKQEFDSYHLLQSLRRAY